MPANAGLFVHITDDLKGTIRRAVVYENTFYARFVLSQDAFNSLRNELFLIVRDHNDRCDRTCLLHRDIGPHAFVGLDSAAGTERSSAQMLAHCARISRTVEDGV
jgi:hypothetical protein